MDRPQGLWTALRPWNARSAILYVRWQEIVSPSYYPLDRAKRYWNGPSGLWTALRPSGTIWTARSANGTAFGLGTPAGLLERPLANGTRLGAWNARKALAALVLFIGRTG